MALIDSEGGAALALPADVLDRAQLEAARDAVVEQWGRLDVLVNAAGGNMPATTLAPGWSGRLYKLLADPSQQLAGSHVLDAWHRNRRRERSEMLHGIPVYTLSISIAP